MKLLGHTIDPSVSEPSAPAASPIALAIPLPELEPHGSPRGTYGLLADPRRGGGAPLAEAITRTSWSQVDLAPADDALADVDIDTAATQPLRLRNALHIGADALASYPSGPSPADLAPRS